MKYTICSVVTKKYLKEFLLTKYSFERFHHYKDVEWFLACDQESKQFLSGENISNINFKIIMNVDDQTSDHNSSNSNDNENFLKIILNKITLISQVLEKRSNIIFLDSDHLFINSLETSFIQHLNNQNIDFILSPHYSDNFGSIEQQYGMYNVGFFALNKTARTLRAIKQWKHLTQNCKQYNLYYEQKPFELIQKDCFSIVLPENYNIGFWRFNFPNSIDKFSSVRLNRFMNEDLFYYHNSQVINFHVHMLNRSLHHNPGDPLKEKIVNLLNISNNFYYQDVLKYYEQLSKRTI